MPQLRRRVAAWPWWAQALAVYATTRLLTTALLLVAWAFQGSDGPAHTWAGPGRPPWTVFVGRWWDGWWYEQIALHGYPSTLPLAHGAIDRNEWAFFPLYPMLVRAVMAGTGGSWVVVAPLVSLVLGAAAMLVVHRLVEVGAPRAVAARPGLPLITVLLVGVFPASATLQAAYTESLALLLVATALLLVVRRHYLWALAPTVALGFTRPVALPLAAVVVAHAAARWWERTHDERTRDLDDARPASGAVPARQWAAMGVLTAVAVASGFVWPAICGWVTGAPDGYLQTQHAWRVHREVGPFAGWERLAQLPLVTDVAIVAVLAALVALVASRSARRLGVELWAWAAAYVGYLVAVSDLISSWLRFLLLAFPLGAAAAGLVSAPPRRARRWLVAIVVASVVLQVVWIALLWWRSPDMPRVGAP